ncbi:MAG: hypothetical protein IT364_18240 [Candidatus Hydrogenedentes bacterium]|nr:hypothetical protein [Candidatus Hydrogenedentota bacterium]
MGDVNVQLVREFFELNLFQVLTNWQQSSRVRPGEHSGQMFVQNTNPGLTRELPFLLQPVDVASIDRAVVEVRAWHGDRIYPSVIEANPVLSQFVSNESRALASEVFGGVPFTTILIVSELPASWELRSRSLQLLQSTGIGHVMEFPILLRDLLAKVDENGNYPSSQTLQTLRLLKRYKLVRNQQMEFAFAVEAPPGPLPRVDAVEESVDE